MRRLEKLNAAYNTMLSVYPVPPGENAPSIVVDIDSELDEWFQNASITPKVLPELMYAAAFDLAIFRMLGAEAGLLDFVQDPQGNLHKLPPLNEVPAPSNLVQRVFPGDPQTWAEAEWVRSMSILTYDVMFIGATTLVELALRPPSKLVVVEPKGLHPLYYEFPLEYLGVDVALINEPLPVSMRHPQSGVKI